MRIRFFALAALALSLAACTQDEAGFLPEGAEGTPIVFTATGLNPAATATAGTRAPADGNWTGVQSVAVLMDGTVKTYNVTPSTVDLTSATLTSTDPYYWTNHNDITVMKNTAQIVHSRHRSVANFIINIISALGAYCFFDNKPKALTGYVIEDTKQLSLF